MNDDICMHFSYNYFVECAYCEKEFEIDNGWEDYLDQPYGLHKFDQKCSHCGKWNEIDINLNVSFFSNKKY